MLTNEKIRAKDIVPHKTSFSTGDGFYGDGPQSFFMEAEKLLELTAQNVKDLIATLYSFKNLDLTNKVSGKFVVADGTLSDAAPYFYVPNVITLHAYEGIEIYAKGYLTNVAVISKDNGDGTFTPLAKSVDSTYRKYSFFNNTDSDIALTICSSTDIPEGQDYQYKIYKIDGSKDYTDSKIEYVESLYPIENLDLANKVSGKFVVSNGTLSDNPSFFYVPNVITLHKNEGIEIYAKGFLTNVAVISKDNGDDTFTPLVKSVDSTYRKYSFFNNTDSDIALTICSSVDAVGNGFDYQYRIVSGDNKNYTDSKIEYVESLYPIENLDLTNKVSGKFVFRDGTLADNPSFFYAPNVITLHAYEGIEIYVEGYLTSVAVISKGNGDDTFTPLVKSVDSTYRKYSFFNNTDSDIALTICSSTDIPEGQDYQYKIYKIDGSKDYTDSKIEYVESLYPIENLDLANKVSGKFVVSNGTLSDNPSFFYVPNVITLHKNEGIEIYAKGFLTNVAVISKDNGDDTFTPLVKSVDSTYRKYSYFNSTNADIALTICSSANIPEGQGCQYKIVSYPAMGANVSMTCFGRIGALGDSYTAGQLYQGSSLLGDFEHKFSWPTNLSKEIGVPISNYGVGGASTRSAKTNANQLPKLLSDSPAECYILALGINDVGYYGASYLGTSSDMDLNDYTQSADTFYGNYYYIIKAIQEHAPNAFVVMLTPHSFYSGNPVYEDFLSAAYDIGSAAGIPVLQTDRLLKNPIFMARQGSHPTIAGYSVMSRLYRSIIEDYLSVNPNDLNKLVFGS